MTAPPEETLAELEPNALTKLNEVADALEDFAEDVPPLPSCFSREDSYFPEG